MPHYATRLLLVAAIFILEDTEKLNNLKYVRKTQMYIVISITEKNKKEKAEKWDSRNEEKNKCNKIICSIYLRRKQR